MSDYATRIQIAVDAASVWAILIDGPRWTEWDPTIDQLEGAIVPGGQLKLYTKVSPGRPFNLRVSEFTPPQRMLWTGGMPLGLFTGTRTYTLTPQDDGTVEFAMTEVFSGLLAPLMKKVMPNLQPSFDDFALALKARAEAVG